jgi:hypothetical protein
MAFAIFAAFALFIMLLVYSDSKSRRRRAFIDRYQWPQTAVNELAKVYPHLTPAERDDIGNGLKQFFHAYLAHDFKFVSMPSQAADELWHAMIVDTRAYKAFCDGAFGRFLHHKPAITLSRAQTTNAGLRRVWSHACRMEKINPVSPARLPLLFDLDGRLKIANGFVYTPDCKALQQAGVTAAGYCGGDFHSSAFDGGTAGFGEPSGGGGGGGDSGSGDGGSSCGGGCGGGGD